MNFPARTHRWWRERNFSANLSLSPGEPAPPGLIGQLSGGTEWTGRDPRPDWPIN